MENSKSMRYQKALCGLALGASALFGASKAKATLVASDSFSYNAGVDINGLNGGSGWAGAWQNNNGNMSIEAQIAGVDPGLMAMGGSLHVSALDSRALRQIDLSAGSAAAQAGLVEMAPTMFGGTQPLLGKPGTTLFVGIVINGHNGGGAPSGSHLYESFNAGGGFNSANKDGEVIFFGRGNANTNYGYERTCGHSLGCGGSGLDYQSSTPYNDGQTHWIVYELDFGASVTVTMWIDPKPGAATPSVASAESMKFVNMGGNAQQWQLPAFHFGWVEIQSEGTTSDFDEYRIADSYNDLSTGASMGASVTATVTSTSTGPATTTTGPATTTGTGGNGGAGQTGPGPGPGPATGTATGNPTAGPGAGPTGAGGGAATQEDPGDTSGCPCNLARSSRSNGSPAILIAMAGLALAFSRRKARRSS